jgi:hypothetical protein
MRVETEMLPQLFIAFGKRKGASMKKQKGFSLIESCLSTVRHVARNVKRWQSGDHLARWTAAGLLEAEKKFRKVKGYRELKELAAKLNPHSTPQQQVA